MEHIDDPQLRDLHRRLLENIRSGQQSLEADITKRIAELGTVTQEVLVNTSGDDGETPLDAACTKGVLPVIDALLKCHAEPTPALFERLIALKTPKSLDMIYKLIPSATEQTTEFAFLVACLCDNRPVIKYLLDQALPIEWIDSQYTGRRTESLYLTRIRDVMIRIVRDADVALMQLLEPAIEVSPVPLFETLYLTAAFYGNEAVTRYLLERMGASIEAKTRAAEIMASRAQLDGDEAKAQQFLKEEMGYRGTAPPVYQGDITGLLTDDEINTKKLDANLMALTVMEKHFRHRHEFQEVLLMRPYTVRISIYALDVALHEEETTSEIVNIIWQQLRDLDFDKSDEIKLIMKGLEWVVTAMGYIDDEYIGLRKICVPGDSNESKNFKELKERIKNLCRPPVESAPFSVLGEFAVWLLMILENVTKYDSGQGLYNYWLRRLARLNAKVSKTYSVLHRLVELHLERPGKNNVFGMMISAGADLTAVDKDGNNILHKAVEAAGKGVKGATELARMLAASCPNLVGVANDAGVVVTKEYVQKLPA